MMITIVQDISYVISGIYSGRTAISIVLWIIASIFLVVATLKHLIRMDDGDLNYLKQTGFLIIGAGIMYVVSCIAQFGLFFNGSAGISMPTGGFFLMLLGIGMMMYPSFVPNLISKIA